MATQIAPKTVSRRGFIITTAAVSGGMVLGFHIPVHAATTSAKAENVSDGGTEVNAWLAIDKDNKVQAGKLSWVSPISSRLLFVNRRGVRFCVASPEELAAMVRLGRLRTHQSEDAFDSAMQGVIERLEPTPSAGIPS